jgi:hypothetical protein
MGRLRAKVRNRAIGGTPGGIIAVRTSAVSEAKGGVSGSMRLTGDLASVSILETARTVAF